MYTNEISYKWTQIKLLNFLSGFNANSSHTSSSSNQSSKPLSVRNNTRPSRPRKRLIALYDRRFNHSTFSTSTSFIWKCISKARAEKTEGWASERARKRKQFINNAVLNIFNVFWLWPFSFRVPSTSFFAFFSTASQCARNYWWQHKNHNHKRTHTFAASKGKRKKCVPSSFYLSQKYLPWIWIDPCRKFVHLQIPRRVWSNLNNLLSKRSSCSYKMKTH